MIVVVFVDFVLFLSLLGCCECCFSLVCSFVYNILPFMFVFYFFPMNGFLGHYTAILFLGFPLLCFLYSENIFILTFHCLCGEGEMFLECHHLLCDYCQQINECLCF